jgi:dihydropteroate synthase
MELPKTKILGIVNITEDSFSDGGKYLLPNEAVDHAVKLVANGADIIDVGAVSSHPHSTSVDSKLEIERLIPVIERLLELGIPISVDSCSSSTQRQLLKKPISFLNDITGFPNPELYDDLACSSCKLIVMHSISGSGRATQKKTEPSFVFSNIQRFFSTRVRELEDAGVGRDRIILDPGMGYFLGSTPEPSLYVLQNLSLLKAEFDLPILVSVSRKSFIQQITGTDAENSSAGSLGAELAAAQQGADYIRTHEAIGLRIGLWLAGFRSEPRELLERVPIWD